MSRKVLMAKQAVKENKSNEVAESVKPVFEMQGTAWYEDMYEAEIKNFLNTFFTHIFAKTRMENKSVKNNPAVVKQSVENALNNSLIDDGDLFMALGEAFNTALKDVLGVDPSDLDW